MAALLCEFCGGKLKTKAGGICECDSCGMEYDKDWVKEKIQEIKGTVKVEGTVEVTGTVKVEGGVSLESMLKRGYRALRDENWEAAEGFFQRALDIDPDAGEAFLGIAMAGEGISERKEFWKLLKAHDFEDEENLSRIRGSNFTPELEAELKDYDAHIALEKLANSQLAESSMAWEEQYEFLRQKYAPASHMVAADGKYILKADGTVLRDETTSGAREDFSDSRWCDIVQLAYALQLVGLRADGTVLAFDSSGKLMTIFHQNEGVCQIAAIYTGETGLAVCGLRKNGTVAFYAALPYDKELGKQIGSWQNIKKVYGFRNTFLGLREDGTVAAPFGTCTKERNVAAIADIGSGEPVFLHKNGTVSFGEDAKKTVSHYKTTAQYNRICKWTEVVDIVSASDCLVGLKRDGTVVAEPITSVQTYKDEEKCDEVSAWRNVVAISSGYSGIIGIQAEGKIIHTGTNYAIENIVKQNPGLRLFDSIETLRRDLYDVQGHKKAAQAKKNAARADALRQEKSQLEEILPDLKGIFSISRRKKVEAQIAEIDAELKKPRRLIVISDGHYQRNCFASINYRLAK